jgi:hypothetical protein
MESVALLTLLFVGIGLFARRFNPPIRVLLAALIAGALLLMYLT